MTPTSSGHETSRFQDLPRSRCEELLASHTTGRVAWNAYDGPEVLPVTYAVYNGDVVFRTSPYGVLAQLAQERCNVAFEIDEIDHENGTAWSVLVRGSSRGVVESFDLVTLWSMEGIVPWATGTRNVFIGITPRTISGRMLKAPFAE